MARLGDILVKEGRINPHALQKALELQNKVGGLLGTNLLELGSIGEDELLSALGRHLETSTANRWDLENIPPSLVHLVPPRLAERYGVVPFRQQGRTLYLASNRPGDALVEDEIAMLTANMTRTFVALEPRIAQALERCYRVQSPTRLKVLAQRLDRHVGTPVGGNGGAAERVGPAPGRPAQPAEPPEPAPEPRRIETGAPAPAKSERPAVDSPAVSLPEPFEPRPLPHLVPPRAGSAPDAAVPLLEEMESPGRSPTERLDLAARYLQAAEIRDDVGDAVLAFVAPYLSRRVLLIQRGERIVGWRGEGSDLSPEGVRALEIPAHEPSTFLTVARGAGFWRGPLPRLSVNDAFLEGLGGERPKESLLLPILLRSKVVAYLYGDNLDHSVEGVPFPELQRLVTKAGLAFEVHVLRNKIRNA